MCLLFLAVKRHGVLKKRCQYGVRKSRAAMVGHNLSEGPKMAAGGPQDGPRRGPRRPQMAPRWSKDSPKRAADGPKVAPTH